jgi:hypothetical protein
LRQRLRQFGGIRQLHASDAITRTASPARAALAACGTECARGVVFTSGVARF